MESPQRLEVHEQPPLIARGERQESAAWSFGYPAPENLQDKSILTFARGELPHFAGIRTKPWRS